MKFHNKCLVFEGRVLNRIYNNSKTLGGKSSILLLQIEKKMIRVIDERFIF